MNVKHTVIAVTIGALSLGAFSYTAFAENPVSDPREALFQQIAELLDMVTNLQIQLNGLQGGNAEVFTSFFRDLTVGDRGADVLTLQVLLNKDVRTRIASAGDGSSGQETDYFGALTADAVARFQELYHKEILAPVDLLEGTGYVGPSTRKKLQAVYEMENVDEKKEHVEIHEDYKVVLINETIQNESVTIDALVPKVGLKYAETETDIFYVGPLADNYVQAGERVVLTGSGFSKNENTILFGEVYVIPIVESASKISFIVPDVGEGVYDISVGNGFYLLPKFRLVIESEEDISVLIKSVSPDVISPYTDVTIIGEGFALEKNTVIVDGLPFSNIPSTDGTTLNFKFVRPTFDKIRFSPNDISGLGEETILALKTMDLNRASKVSRKSTVVVISANGDSEVFMIYVK